MFVVLFSSIILIINFVKNDSDDSISGSGDEFLFLLAGVDSTGEETGTRTDTLMLVKANSADRIFLMVFIDFTILIYSIYIFHILR